MAYYFKKKENIGNKTTEYSRYYSAFRGVDFSSDHTQVHESRFAYLVNMYKDYKSGQGESVETIAGFRQRAKFNDDSVYGIFYFKCKVDGVETERVLVHSGESLYLWRNYPHSINILTEKTVVAENQDNTLKIKIDFPLEEVVNLKTLTGETISGWTKMGDELVFTFTLPSVSNNFELTYYEGKSDSSDILYSGMNKRRSSSFICNNRLYIIDGKNYLVYDGVTVKRVKEDAYIPTTYINIIPSDKNGDSGKEYEVRNILSPYFKNTFVANGEAKEYFLNEADIDEIVSVKVYGKTVDEYNVDTNKGKITFTEAPKAPKDEGYDAGYAGVEIVAEKTWKSLDGIIQEEDIADIIESCTLCATFDDRVFLSGNPKYHNLLFWCRLTQGYANPSYFGVIDWTRDGVGNAPITGLMGVSDTLMVLKADTQQDSSVYFHTGETVDNIATRIYPKSQGLSGLGCIGACRNFLDDPIFISKLGVEGVSQLKIASERTNEHRSSLIDAKLVNTDLASACLEEWGGYLWLLTDGKIFLADSRQRYADNTGVMQYEWYYLEGIGVWENQHKEYLYSSSIAPELADFKVENNGKEYDLELAENVYSYDLNENQDLRGIVANSSNSLGKIPQIYTTSANIEIGESHFDIKIEYILKDIQTAEGEETRAFLVESRGNYREGEFKKATVLYTMSDNVFFGCENGVVCSFNFDQRNKEGDLPFSAYAFDNRIINCGCATKMDNCQIPHLTKSTIKRSTVIKTKSFKNSTAKIKVRTNKKPYEQIARINSGTFAFDDMDFTNFSFSLGDNSLFAIKEKEKQWVEKQYYVYSDEYMKPFSLYYISYRYNVAGRYKN